MTHYRKLTAFLIAFILPLITLAQEKKLDVDIDINKQEDDWYRQPWVWVVGLAVFILILVAILKSGKKSD